MFFDNLKYINFKVGGYPMYKIVFGRPGNYTILHDNLRLSDVKSKRKQSGDIVLRFDFTTVKHTFWLFEWEKENPNCYAQKVIRDGWKY